MAGLQPAHQFPLARLQSGHAGAIRGHQQATLFGQQGEQVVLRGRKFREQATDFGIPVLIHVVQPRCSMKRSNIGPLNFSALDLANFSERV